MTWLGEWLKQIILIVMLAVMTDLLLPTKAMQRYVRMVMGLAIIAAMLQPIVPYFRRDWADQAAQAALQEFNAGTRTGAEAGNIKAQGFDWSELRRKIQQEEATDAAKAIAGQLTDAIAARFGVGTQVVVQGVDPSGQSAEQLSIQIAVRQEDLIHADAIRRFAAQTVDVSESQVSVVARQGGETSGS